MEEKKLTDELLKELQEDVEIYKKDFRMFGDYFEIEHLEKAIDFIRSLRNTEKANEEAWQIKEESYKQQIAGQKAEIERLTAEIDQRREMMSRMDCNYATELRKNAELQKQVDELKKENARLDKNVKWFQEKIENGELFSEQAVKDTAKEIFAELFYMASIHHSDVANILAWAKEKAKQKGVEVE